MLEVALDLRIFVDLGNLEGLEGERAVAQKDFFKSIVLFEDGSHSESPHQSHFFILLYHCDLEVELLLDL